MKKTVLITSIIAIALARFGSAQSSPAASGSDNDVIAMEKSIWETVKNKEIDAFKKFLAPEYAGVYAEGIMDANSDADGISKVELRQYSFGSVKVSHPDNDVAILTYTNTVEGTYESKDISGTWNCASVWVKKNGKWLAAFHSEVKAEKP